MNRTPTPGQSIKLMRNRANLTAEQLATEAGVSPAYLSRVENDKSRPSDKWVSEVLACISVALAKKAADEALPLASSA
ncbi:helix-turn-helix domain-containing protein [Rhodococcus globerulus]|uniref:helix-turn-helix domain-containing protein n=1 Tax=Rhodococcus globerulus TaxID=33008 RepID=UPI0039E921EC